MKNLNEKGHYPFTYGDKSGDEVMRNDYVVKLMKTKRFQSHVTAIFFALLALGSYAQPSSAIPPEYGEAGRVPAALPIGQIEGQVPVFQGNTQFVIPAIPIEQQRLIATQQMSQRGDMPKDPAILSFYLPSKPILVGPRTVNTVAFTAALRSYA